MAKDMNGQFCGEIMGGIHGLSKDGMHWEFEKDNLFYSRRILWNDGITREMGNLDRPFILFEDGEPACAFLLHLMAQTEWDLRMPQEPGIWLYPSSFKISHRSSRWLFA